MQVNKKTKAIKDVSILDERVAAPSSNTVNFLFNNLEENKCIEIEMGRPTYFKNMITVSIDSISSERFIPYNKINSFKSFARNIRSFVLNLFAFSLKPIEFDTFVFDTRDNEPNNIAHLMIQVIPFCLHARNLSNKNIQFISHKLSAPYKKLLNEFDINPIVTNRKIKGSLVKVFGTRGFAAYDISNVFDCPPITFVPDIYNNYQFSSGLEKMNKIFISRRGARALKNHVEVEKLLADHGYKTIYMEDYSIGVQLGIASEANDIVAVHGASMGMLVLRKSINSLIEICPPNIYHEFFSVALGSRVKKYIQIMDTLDSRVAFNDYSTFEFFKSKAFSANIQQLNRALEMIN